MLKKIFIGIFFIIFFLILLFFTCGCGSGELIVISQPPAPSVIVLQPEQPVIMPDSTRSAELDSLNAAPSADEILMKPFKEYLPDPCKGIIKNYSAGLVMWVWLNNSPPAAEPAFRLEPQQAKTIYAPVGSLKIYATAYQKTAYGWRKVGAYSQEQAISPYAYSVGDFNWRVYLSDWNFPGMR